MVLWWGLVKGEVFRSQPRTLVEREQQTQGTYLLFYVLLTVHPCISLQIKPTWCTILLSMFISFLYVFRATTCPSSGETTVSMRDLVLATSDKYQVSHRYSCFSGWWAHIRPKHVEKEINILRRIVHQVGFIYKSILLTSWRKSVKSVSPGHISFWKRAGAYSEIWH